MNMENIPTGQELNYSWLIMAHLNRISMLTTGDHEETLSENQRTYVRMDIKALQWSIAFLRRIIPDDMIDDKYKTDKKNLFSENTSVDFNILIQHFGLLVNLLHRHGMLMTSRVSAGIGKSKLSQDEVFED